jgi:hypothetical protein
MKIWGAYVTWRQTIIPKLKEEDQMFVTTVDDKKVWLIEDGAAFTAMFPEDYFPFTRFKPPSLDGQISSPLFLVHCPDVVRRESRW